MSQLVIEGMAVPVAVGSDMGDVPWGDFGRAFSGKARSDFKAHHRSFRIQAVEMDATDALALRLLLQSPGALSCSGDLIGTAADFHARNVRVRPLTADDHVVSFELHETDDQPAVLLFSFDGNAPGSPTFTRSGAVGKYTDAAGVLQDAASDALRLDQMWLDGDYDDLPDTVAGLIEAARTNLISSDDLTAWSVTGTPSVTGSQSDPAGGSGAYTVADDDGASTELIYRDVTYTGDGVKSAVFVVRENTMPASGVQALQIFDATGATPMLDLEISAWSSGVPTVAAGAAGTYLGKRYVGNGYWAIYGKTASVTASNTNRARILPAETAAQTGSIDVYRVATFDAVVPLYSIVDASETKNADTLYGAYSHVPQALTVYAKFIEWGSVNDDLDGGIIHIGSATVSTDPRFLVRASGGFYLALHDNGTASPTATLAAAPSVGDTVELRAVLNADGSVDLGQSINAGAETTASDATAAALGAAWADTRLYIGSLGTGNRGMNPIIAVKVVSGVRTMAQMRNFATARLHRRVA